MNCPFCGIAGTRVLDSRMAKGGEQIRRRRECEGCTQRFTTYERVETGLPTVIKKGGGRVPYDREKVRTGVVRATWKREVTDREIDDFLDQVEQRFRERGVRDIPSRDIGQEVLRFLLKRDQVAYVRFASVYGDFSDLTEFADLLHGLDNGE
jgi:transcriptional repressor NrdR